MSSMWSFEQKAALLVTDNELKDLKKHHVSFLDKAIQLFCLPDNFLSYTRS